MNDCTPMPQPSESNPIAMEGVEFIEYAAANPDAFRKTLEKMGFSYIAKHRSREIFLYRQGSMTIVVNADPEMAQGTDLKGSDAVISGVAFRVADARHAYRHMVDQGAWPIQTRAGAMELNIPGLHGVGDAIIYLVDRYRDFSIFDVDFVYEAQVSRTPPAIANMHFFGLVQYVGADRMEEWIDFYRQLTGFSLLTPGNAFGILPRGNLLQSPCGNFYLQLIAPPDNLSYDVEWNECFARLGIGTPDVKKATHLLLQRGIAFEDNDAITITEKGALTAPLPGKVYFELVATPQYVPA